MAEALLRDFSILITRPSDVVLIEGGKIYVLRGRDWADVAIDARYWAVQPMRDRSRVGVPGPDVARVLERVRELVKSRAREVYEFDAERYVRKVVRRGDELRICMPDVITEAHGWGHPGCNFWFIFKRVDGRWVLDRMGMWGWHGSAVRYRGRWIYAKPVAVGGRWIDVDEKAFASGESEEVVVAA